MMQLEKLLTNDVWTQVLANPGFEEGWDDIVVEGLSLVNQRPKGWSLEWVKIGDELYEDTLTAEVVPECVHKPWYMLPEDERIDGSHPLILDKRHTYKVFAAARRFGAALEQTVTSKLGRGMLRLLVPVCVHSHGDSSPGSAEYRICLNGVCTRWLTYGDGFTDRVWNGSTVEVEAGEDGADSWTATVRLEMKSRHLGGNDFFIDGARLCFIPYVAAPECPPCPEPAPIVGVAREPYDRTYVLLPPGADATWAEAVIAAGWDAHHWTIGGSADDAGAGVGMGSKTVKAVNPQLWSGDLAGFFTQYYPGVIYQPITAATAAELVTRLDGSVSPEPSEPEPVVPPVVTSYVPRGTKIGIHAIGDSGMIDFYGACARAGAPLATVKGCESVGFLKEIKAVSPTTTTVARFINGTIPGISVEFAELSNPVGSAQITMQSLLPLYAQHRAYVDYFEVGNELDPVGPEGHVKLAQFYIECMRIAQQHGYRLAILSYSYGVPEPAEWDAIATTGLFGLAAAGGHAISLHEYGQMPGDAPYCLTRYRDLYRRHIIPAGLDIPLFITEYNVHASWLPKAPAELVAQWAAYDAELAKDTYVAGAHVFTVGGFGSWATYESAIYAARDAFVAYAVAVKDRANA